MTIGHHLARGGVIDSIGGFDEGAWKAVVENLAPKVTFVAPGESAVAGTYHDRHAVADFFGRLHRISEHTLTAEPLEVLATDERLVVFLHLRAQRGSDRLDLAVANFLTEPSDRGWRKAAFVPNDLKAFDRFFASG